MKFYHYSDDVVELDYSMQYHQEFGQKPNGLWFSVGTSWEDYWSETMESGIANCHEVTLKSLDGVLVFNHLKDIYQFNQKYCKLSPKHAEIAQRGDPPIILPQWDMVAKDYTGIFIPKFNKNYSVRRDDDCLWSTGGAGEWYDSLDCSCLCVWDLSLVDDFKLIK